MIEYWTNVSASLVAAIVFFFLGMVASRTIHAVEKRKFFLFFGRNVSRNEFRIIYGMICQLPFECDTEPTNQRLQKTYSDGSILNLRGTKELITQETVRSFSYLLQEFAKYIHTPIHISTDQEAIPWLDTTFFSIGGPVTNEISKWGLEEESGSFFKFKKPANPNEGEWMLEVNTGNRQACFNHPPSHGTDFGVILKIQNSRFPEQFFFLCAGIGSWGTSGATWYLSHNWKNLYREYGSTGFGVVVEVKKGSDSSAKVVFSHSWCKPEN